MKSMTFYWQNH